MGVIQTLFSVSFSLLFSLLVSASVSTSFSVSFSHSFSVSPYVSFSVSVSVSCCLLFIDLFSDLFNASFSKAFSDSFSDPFSDLFSNSFGGIVQMARPDGSSYRCFVQMNGSDGSVSWIFASNLVSFVSIIEGEWPDLKESYRQFRVKKRGLKDNRRRVFRKKEKDQRRKVIDMTESSLLCRPALDGVSSVNHHLPSVCVNRVYKWRKVIDNYWQL